MSANPRDIPTMRMVVGSTSERYDPVELGLIRYNTTDNNVEAYAAGGWVNLQGGSGGGKWTLGVNGEDDYTFEGTGLTGAVNDPTLYLVRGNKYTFVNGNGTGTHPFKIQTTNGFQYDTGVTNNLGGGGTTITFEVPQDAPNELEYVCTSHSEMSGKLIIVGSGGVGSDASLSSIVQYTDNSGITFLSDVSVNGVLNSTDGSFSGNLYSVSGIIGGASGWVLGANGHNYYTFTGSGLDGSESNPTLNLFRGNKYIFINNNNIGAHPFQISNSDDSPYGTGVTNNGGKGGSTITFEVPHDAPKTLKYKCISHPSAMNGVINIHGGGIGTDASFNVIDEFMDGSGVTFLTDVSINTRLTVPDASFNRIEPIDGSMVIVGDLSVTGQIFTSGDLLDAGGGGGNEFVCKQTTANSTTTASSSNVPYTITGDYFDATINLTTNTQKVVIQFHLFGEWNTTSTRDQGVVLQRKIGAGSWTLLSNWGDGECPARNSLFLGGDHDTITTPQILNFVYVDTPGTTGEISYRPALVTSESNRSFYLNRTTDHHKTKHRERGVSTFTLEVKD